MSKLDLDAVKARQQEVRDAIRRSHGPEWKFNLQKAVLFSSEDVSPLIKEVEALREALGWFVDDDRFQVGVGGNPNVVEAMIAEAKARHSSDTLKTEQEASK